MKTLCNILWHFPYLGFLFSLGIFLLGALFCLTIIFIPFGKGLIEFAKFLLAPFSRKMVKASDLKYLGRYNDNILGKGYNTIIAIIYFPIGLILSICVICIIIAECVTILGIPAAIIWAKSLRTIFNPVAMVCVSDVEYEAIMQRKIASI